MSTLQRDFGELYFRARGNGSTAIVLLHDYFGTHRSWLAVQNQLARYFLVVAPDLRGHGRSRLERGVMSISADASDITAILDYLGIGTAHLVGLSHGAIIALHMARAMPDRISSIVITSAPDIRDPDVIDYGLDYAERVFPTLEQNLERTHGAGEPGYVRKTLLESFRRSLQDLPHDFRDAVGRSSEIACPSLVLGGDRDPVMNLESSVALMRSMPDAKLAILPAAGHLANQDAPNLYTEAVLDHILRCERAKCFRPTRDLC